MHIKASIFRDQIKKYSMKVLVVDDSKTMLRILGNVLKQLGIEDIRFAGHGREAWEIIRTNKIDILFTDWNMPIMNGLELVKQVRGKEELDNMPIIMITTEGGKREVITALKAGVDNYIVKPFTPTVLKEKLKDICYV